MAQAQNMIVGSSKNIVHWYEQSNSFHKHYGRNFYPLANQRALEFGRSYGYPDDLALQVGAGLLAVFSPRLDWRYNLKYVEEFIEKGIAKNSTRVMNDKAKLISLCHDPMSILGRTAYKTKSFYSAIHSPLGKQDVYSLDGIEDGKELCVIDRHAGGIYLGRPLVEAERKRLSNPKVYQRISGGYYRTAKLLGIHVNELQSITWYTFREQYKHFSVAASRKRARRTKK